jgi:uncharacterized protein with PIN domain
LKFIADGMLGKLTRWLRMLGQDVEYSNNAEDSKLLAVAKKENRILLTRDFELYQRALGKNVDAFYLEGATGEEKLAELAKRYGIPLEIDMSISRCPKCNSLVKPVPQEKLVETVEKNTFEHYKEFWQCSKCGQIYWQGAHWTRIKKSLETARKILQKQEKER